jgi:hypothetical protein
MMENQSPNLDALPRYVDHCFKGQMLNTIIQVKYPPHLDVLMLELQ